MGDKYKVNFRIYPMVYTYDYISSYIFVLISLVSENIALQ